MENKKQVVMYGISGVEGKYIPICYNVFFDGIESILDMRHTAEMMIMKNSNVDAVYVLDNRKYLKRAFEYAQRKNTIEAGVEFKDLLERYGVKLV